MVYSPSRPGLAQKEGARAIEWSLLAWKESRHGSQGSPCGTVQQLLRPCMYVFSYVGTRAVEHVVGGNCGPPFVSETKSDCWGQ